MTKFYGFLKNNEEIKGFVYEYMNNNTLYSFLTSKEKMNKTENFFSMLSIIRLFKAIEYLQIKSLIHRDIKPSNVLIDHNFIPYLSDYDRIRHPLNSEENQNFTHDIGSFLYTSPEQEEGKNISFQTDIYSFGLMIYFIYEKKHMWSQNKDIYLVNKEQKPFLLTKSSSKIKNLYLDCIKFDQKQRPKIDTIKNILIQEMNPFDYLEELFDNESKLTKYQFINLLYEYLLFKPMKQNEILQFINSILSIYLIQLKKNDKDESLYYLCIGDLYFEGMIVKQSYSKAIKYYKISAKKGNQQALLNLGSIFLKGSFFIEKNYEIARKYYELAAELNNSDALYYLGNFYYEGLGVKKDYLIAKKYYEKSAQQNNPNALFNLSIFYEKGYGVKQDYSIARNYLELAAKQNDSASLLNLGYYYELGLGVEKNYIEAKKYYELSSKLNNSDAIFSLGNLYYEIDHDYSKAKYYFELAAQQNNAKALYQLGVFFTKKDWLLIKIIQKQVHIIN